MTESQCSLPDEYEGQNVIYITGAITVHVYFAFVEDKYFLEDHRPDWTHEPTKELLKLYDEKIDMLDTGIIGTHKKIWELVSKEMIKKEYYFSPSQCENKWKTLKRNYKAKYDRIERFGSCSRYCPFERYNPKI